MTSARRRLPERVDYGDSEMLLPAADKRTFERVRGLSEWA